MTNDELNKAEDKLIEAFRNHLVFKNIEVISDSSFLRILLQRRFLSLIFTVVYDLSIDAIENRGCKEIVRKILRDEYPLRNFEETPTHREDMFHDLLMVGAKREDILKELPSKITKKVIEETLAMVQGAATEESAELKVLTILRFWGEVLVAFEYQEYWKRLASYFNEREDGRSRFYQPHFEHDIKTKSLFDTSILETTHSDRLGFYLNRLLKTEGDRRNFINTEQAVFKVKYKFYDQFLPLVNF
jgi:hypothetical protein